MPGRYYIKTLTGDMWVYPGDWIVTIVATDYYAHISGEYLVFNPKTFEATYEPVE